MKYNLPPTYPVSLLPELAPHFLDPACIAPFRLNLGALSRQRELIVPRVVMISLKKIFYQSNIIVGRVRECIDHVFAKMRNALIAQAVGRVNAKLLAFARPFIDTHCWRGLRVIAADDTRLRVSDNRSSFARSAGTAIFCILAGCSGASRPVDSPRIPAFTEVSRIQIREFTVDNRGDLASIGLPTNVDQPGEIREILEKLDALSDNFVDATDKREMQFCWIAMSDYDGMMMMVRVGPDWMTIQDREHVAEDGFTLVGRDRALNVQERSTLPCN